MTIINDNETQTIIETNKLLSDGRVEYEKTTATANADKKKPSKGEWICAKQEIKRKKIGIAANASIRKP